MKRLEWANALRGIAALIVLGYHFSVAFWMSQDVSASLARRTPLYPGDQGAPVWARAISALPVDLAALGVALFFLLSGFVISISLERYSRAGFLVGRAMRLLPTYAAGYLITCLTIAAMSDPGDELHVGSVLLGSVPGLAYLVRASAPGDGIVWTLIVELVFYGVCVVVFRRLTTRWWAIAAVAAGCALVQTLVPHLPRAAWAEGIQFVVLLACPFIPVMLVGVTLFVHRAGRLRRGPAVVLVLALVGEFVVLASTTPVVPTSWEYRLTFVGAVGVFAAVAAVGDRWTDPGRLLGFLAAISYPLYVVHPVLGYALISWLAGRGVWGPLAVLIAGAAAIGCATAIHFAVEKRTHHLGRRWAGRTRTVPTGSGAGTHEVAGVGN
ncbi:acyltransferase family protein [Cellulomonas soli]